MKKLLAIILTLSLLLSMGLTVLAEEDEEESASIVDAVNSGFEGVTDVQKTDWFRLVNASGDSTDAPAIYQDIEIKTDGGHTGNNYLKVTTKQSWVSPSINIHPFIKEAGANTYVISFYFKTTPDASFSRFLLRGLPTDATDAGEYDFDLIPRGSGNHYAEWKSESDPPTPGVWRLFVSDPFEVVDEQLTDDHNWWFCFDQLKCSDSEPLEILIDDFVIVPEDQFEYPESAVTEIVTDVTYLTDAVIDNVIPVVSTEASADTNDTNDTNDATSATPTATAQSQTGDLNNNAEPNGMKTGTVVIIAIVALVAAAGISAVIVVNIKKKK